ncbi:hypothetical protein T08_6777 [Trichinella sp. T8]|nr:hypothetical protein T08_6777 [Trichinella sp. T8]
MLSEWYMAIAVCLPHFQRTYSLLYTCSAHFHRIIRVETPSTTPPSTNLSCETERKSLFESFSVVFPPAHRTSSIKISVPPSQCTIPIQRVIPRQPNHHAFAMPLLTIFCTTP